MKKKDIDPTGEHFYRVQYDDVCARLAVHHLALEKADGALWEALGYLKGMRSPDADLRACIARANAARAALAAVKGDSNG